MKTIRERFEEIWPVPEEIFWSEGKGEYWPVSNGPYDANIAEQWDARLDTFTRCQESMGPVLSLVEEMVMEIEGLAIAAYGCVPLQSQDILDSAKQILGRDK